MDLIRAEINSSHRFHSFAGERTQNFVKWSVYYLRSDMRELRNICAGTSTDTTTCMRSPRCSKARANASSFW